MHTSVITEVLKQIYQAKIFSKLIVALLATEFNAIDGT
jgi:hypothetical protein